MTASLLLLALLATASPAPAAPATAAAAPTGGEVVPPGAAATPVPGEVSPEVPTAAATPTPAAQLAQVVLVSRHGVRSPIEPMQRYAAQAWPKWPVAPGQLTARGRRLAVLLGAHYREHYAALGLLPDDGCPRDGFVWFWSDTADRDVQTSEGLLEGMLPGCKVAVKTSPSSPDPLFHPLGAGVCRLDVEQARAAVLGRIGAAPEALAVAYREPLSRLQKITGCCQPKACGSPGANCTLFDLPAGIDIDEKAGSIHLVGPIAVGSILAEDLMLAYADGRPGEQVGWGRATLEALIDTARLHTLQFDLDYRTREIARARASALAVEIAGALEQGSTGRKATRVRAPSRSRFVTYVGNDTNIASLAGLLGLEWLNESWQRNQTPPTSALAFELWRPVDDGDPFVRAYYIAQSLGQMRAAATLSAESPPSRAPIHIPGCGVECPLDTFTALVRDAADPACVRR